MTKSELARSMYLDEKDPHNCAQAVLCAFSEDYGISRDDAMRMAVRFGRGMGLGSSCGTVSGGLMVLALPARTMRLFRNLPADSRPKPVRCAAPTCSYAREKPAKRRGTTAPAWSPSPLPCSRNFSPVKTSPFRTSAIRISMNRNRGKHDS